VDRIADLGNRLTGSFDLYGDDGTAPLTTASISVPAMTGSPLRSRVFTTQAQEANLEDKGNGSDQTIHGIAAVEGETEDETVRTLRKQFIKNYSAIFFFASGIPMIRRWATNS